MRIIELTPQVHGNADAALAFDRIHDAPGTRTLVGRRRVSVMIHTHERITPRRRVQR